MTAGPADLMARDLVLGGALFFTLLAWLLAGCPTDTEADEGANVVDGAVPPDAPDPGAIPGASTTTCDDPRDWGEFASHVLRDPAHDGERLGSPPECPVCELRRKSR